MAAASAAFGQPNSSRVYQIVFLRRNPERKALGKEEGDRLQAAHMANVHAMAHRGGWWRRVLLTIHRP
jgi:hypothetical protein